MSTKRKTKTEKPRMPLAIRIPIPSHIAYQRGADATGLFGDSIKVRTSESEKKLIATQAKRIGVTSSEFIRHSAVRMAKELAQYRID